ncbi:MAG: aconitate hydratase [Methanobacteriota archaeon]
MTTVSEKIIGEHLVEGECTPGSEISISIDQTLTQDATGTMAYLQFEALRVEQVKTKLSVSYVDHNTLQSGPNNADDHAFLQSFASKYGIYYSKPGNGICHQVHLERFGVPGQTLLGSDSHTPTQGGLGMLAIGAGGLDVAVAMAGHPFHFIMPEIIGVELTGSLPTWSSAKDVILHLLSELSVEGGVGKIIEYFGDGVSSLTVPERATITNMGAELGATTSIFPSDEVTKSFLKSQGRVESWTPLSADSESDFSQILEVNLSEIEPLVAKPHSPDNVVPVSEISGTEVDQVLIGSCTNSSLKDMLTIAELLRGEKIHPNVSLGIAPGSRQVLEILSETGALTQLIKAGARILESACGPCIGMGQSPKSGAVSLRTFNRNFKGRSSTPDAGIYLVSPETAAASAINGVVTDPRNIGKKVDVNIPKNFLIDDSMIIPPSNNPDSVKVIRGPNIKPLPKNTIIEDPLSGVVLLKVGDNITTDDIMPAGAKILPLRSNIPAISEFVYSQIDPTFAARAKEAGGGFIIGGVNYGQGSSREHAALAPMYLGVKAVLAKSFARIHKANLINFGILPLTFSDEGDYDKIEQDDEITIGGVREKLSEDTVLTASIGGMKIELSHDLTGREIKILIAGGLLNYVKSRNS